MARRDVVLELARAGRSPDLTASLGFVTQGFDDRESRALGLGPDGPSLSRATRLDDDRDNRIEFEVSIPLPIFNRNQGNIKEAEHLISKASDERLVTLTGVKAAITDQHKAALAAYDEIVSLNDAALPMAEDAFNAVQKGYDEGKFGYLEVLDAQRTLFELRIQLLDSYLAYHIAVVEIERLLGEPIQQRGEIFGTSVKEANHE